MLRKIAEATLEATMAQMMIMVIIYPILILVMPMIDMMTNHKVRIQKYSNEYFELNK